MTLDTYIYPMEKLRYLTLTKAVADRSILLRSKELDYIYKYSHYNIRKFNRHRDTMYSRTEISLERELV